jgi:hypothetical protein
MKKVDPCKKNSKIGLIEKEKKGFFFYREVEEACALLEEVTPSDLRILLHPHRWSDIFVDYLYTVLRPKMDNVAVCGVSYPCPRRVAASDLEISG